MVQGWLLQIRIAAINMYAPNKRTSKHVSPKLVGMQTEINE